MTLFGFVGKLWFKRRQYKKNELIGTILTIITATFAHSVALNTYLGLRYATAFYFSLCCVYLFRTFYASGKWDDGRTWLNFPTRRWLKVSISRLNTSYLPDVLNNVGLFQSTETFPNYLNAPREEKTRELKIYSKVNLHYFKN